MSFVDFSVILIVSGELDSSYNRNITKYSFSGAPTYSFHTYLSDILTEQFIVMAVVKMFAS